MTDLTDAKKIFTDKMQFVTDTLNTDKMILCFSDKLNFRKVVSETYKANRKATRKPTGYRSFIRWAKDKYKFYWKPSLEADDCMGIMQTMPGSDTIIVSDDKDMKITHVIRAEEHLSNTLRQMLIFEAIGHEPPV